MGAVSMLALGSQRGGEAHGWQHGYPACMGGDEQKNWALA